jgi:hypothetical protein
MHWASQLHPLLELHALRDAQHIALLHRPKIAAVEASKMPTRAGPKLAASEPVNAKGKCCDRATLRIFRQWSRPGYAPASYRHAEYVHLHPVAGHGINLFEQGLCAALACALPEGTSTACLLQDGPSGRAEADDLAGLQRAATRLKLPEADWQRGRVVDADPGVKRQLYGEP